MEPAASAPFTPAGSRVETSNVVLPGFTNVHGTIFGGILMQWIDIAAAIAAARHAVRTAVTPEQAAMAEALFQRVALP